MFRTFEKVPSGVNCSPAHPGVPVEPKNQAYRSAVVVLQVDPVGELGYTVYQRVELWPSRCGWRLAPLPARAAL